METDFLKAPVFKPEPWYNLWGDCIEYKTVDEASIADHIDQFLTVYRSAVSNNFMGFQLVRVKTILGRVGSDSLAFEKSSHQSDPERHISIKMLLLAAYEEGTPSVYRRRGYAAANIPLEVTLPLSTLMSHPNENNDFFLLKLFDIFVRKTVSVSNGLELKRILTQGDLSDQDLKWFYQEISKTDFSGTWTRPYIYRLLEETLRNREERNRTIEEGNKPT